MRDYINLFEAKDVDGDVNLSERDLTEISEEYSVVARSFWCSNNQLTSLKGAPREVGESFYCNDNNLSTLEGSPDVVGTSFWAQRQSPGLISLKGAPEKVGANFLCGFNQLKTLEGAPMVVGHNFECSDNELTSLKGVPKFIGGRLNCRDNPNLTPWEMRYILFTGTSATKNDVRWVFRSDHEEANELINEFMKQSQEEKQVQMPEYLERLKKMK